MKSDIKDLSFRVIIKFHDFLRLLHKKTNKESHVFWSSDSSPLEKLVKLIPDRKINKLFTSLSNERIIELAGKAMKLDSKYQPPNFLNYYAANCDSEAEAKKLVEILNKHNEIELSYIETHSARSPSLYASANPLSFCQGYLNSAPLGIDARYAWSVCGGNGSSNVKFIDIEQGWIFDHEDLKINQLPNTGLNHWEHRDHGTGVLGIIMMEDNATGGIGITPKANGYAMSQWRPNGSFNTADAIMAAIDHLDFGDILLLEMQTFDVLHNKKIWPAEILDANFQAIRLATALGVIVIEAAGNGIHFIGNDLDFFTDKEGRNSFSRSSVYFKDSGAIMVAAASSNVPHAKINYSNYGSRMDCFAWGENILTAGLFPRSSRFCTNTYSEGFGGTSGASAIIAGVVIATQSIAEAKYSFRISPMQMRNILSSELYGTISENGHKVDKIGVMPDLKKIIDQALDSMLLPDKRQ